MPWKKGTSGNPNGNPGKDKLFRTALLMELKRKGEDMPELRQIARTLISLAVGGEMWAIKEIADRLDGKASVVVTDQDEVRSAQDLSDDELDALIAKGRRLLEKLEKDDSVH
jgi:hypothetical protein